MPKEFATNIRQIDADENLLTTVLAKGDLGANARQAFVDMLARLKRFVGLTERQRAWVQREAAILGIPVAKPEQLSRVSAASAWDPGPNGSSRARSSRMKRAVKSLDKALKGKPKRSKS